ncbi:MAG: aminoglycoside 3'-phosphotransferase [Oscillospiraceae bacterium]|jgi:kanamycin kinase|nr:aminoglycoside 3'-phosphotransferase [Oscillospiraceae bacterium]
MKLTPITINLADYPAEFYPLLNGAKLYDSSSSPDAKVIFIDKGCGYFLKSAPAGTALRGESYMTQYFHKKNLAPKVVSFIPDYNGREFMLSEKIPGDDCTAAKYLGQPEKLCDTIAERLVFLHSLGCSDCLVNHTNGYIERAKNNYLLGKYDKDLFPDNWGYTSAEEARSVIERSGHLLKADTLLHGDYCLPNIILDDWRFSGFIDLDSGGVGDKHVDIFWGAWTLFFNLKTDKYRDRFLDAYGRGSINAEMLRVVAACEVFA